MFKKIMFALCLASGVSACGELGSKGGMPDYCFVVGHVESTMMRPGQLYFDLWGHRKWSGDLYIGRYVSIDEAVATAQKVQCPFRY